MASIEVREAVQGPMVWGSESSHVELRLAFELAPRLLAKVTPTIGVVDLVEALARGLTAGGRDRLRPEWVANAFMAMLPSTARLDLVAPFPKSHDEVTSNLFACIAYECTRLAGNRLAHGVVTTPSILARDMVIVAAGTKLSSHFSTPLDKTIRALASAADDRGRGLTDEYKSVLRKLRWYDPCVGGGVFPVAVAIFLAQVGCLKSSADLKAVTGADIDPLAVSVASIRLALVVSGQTGEPYSKARRSLSNQFVAQDSLTVGSEQQMLGDSLRDRVADIVIANPPYVRASRLPSQTRSELRQMYPSVASGFADLYSYFIAHGLFSLDGGGVLCYVTPAGFQRSVSGSGTRSLVSQLGSLRLVYDFNELPVFDADLHTSVFVIERSVDSSGAFWCDLEKLPSVHPLTTAIDRASRIPTPRGSDPWLAPASAVVRLIDTTGVSTVRLAHYAGGIYSGIKTGCKAAFVLDATTARSLMRDPVANSLIRPMVRPDSIRKWRSKWDHSHLLLLKKGTRLIEGSLLHQHLLEYERELRARSDMADSPDDWYCLRSCDYYELFEGPKIVFPDISAECRFAIDLSGFFLPDGAFFLPTADHYLTAILNSSLALAYFRARCNSVGNPHNGGRLRFKKTHVAEFPMVPVERAPKGIVDRLRELGQIAYHGRTTQGLQEQIDALVLVLYGIKARDWLGAESAS